MQEQTFPSSPSQLHYDPQLAQVSTLWKPLLEEPLRSQALEAARVVAQRMRDLDFVQATAKQAEQQSIYPMRWSAQSLAAGCGAAIMYGYFDQCFPGQGWDSAAQSYLSLAASESQQTTSQMPGLFGGVSGMALALDTASHGGTRYQKTLARLQQGICEQVLAQRWRRPQEDGGVANHDYDVISGAAGILAYLVSIKQPDTLVQSTIEYVVEYLLWLGEPGQAVAQERWYVPNALLAAEHQREMYPQGNFNCGLAHGIPGPLAALAVTWLAGYRYAGLRESISYLSKWLQAHQVSAPWGRDWPDAVSLEAASSPEDWKALSATRSAWCYGSAGVARALWLAGQALEDKEVGVVAVETIEAVLRRPASQRGLPSPTICHGVAGLLEICLRFGHECDSTLVREQIPMLTEQILSLFTPESALGFCDLDQTIPLDDPSWLTGAPGTATVLLAASTSVVPAWDRGLVIA